MGIIEYMGQYQAIQWALQKFISRDFQQYKSISYNENNKQRDINIIALADYIKKYIKLIPATPPKVDNLPLDIKLIVEFAYEVSILLKQQFE